MTANFSDWTINNGGKDFKKEGHGAFQIFTTSQVVRFDCYGMQEVDMNALMNVLMDFGCPLYAPKFQQDLILEQTGSNSSLKGS